MKMISILGVYLPIHNTSDPDEPLSGGERHFFQVIKRINPCWINFHLETTQLGLAISAKEGLEPIKYHLVHSPFESILSKSIVRFLLISISCTVYAIIAALRIKYKFDKVCSSSHYLFDLLPAVIASRKSKAKLIVYLHLLEPPPFERAKYHPFLPSILVWVSQRLSIALTKRYADYIFTLPVCARQTVREGIARDKIKMILNGIDIKEFDKTGQREIKYEACFLTRLSPLKGVFDLPHIWRNIVDNIPNARLAIMGLSESVKYNSQLEELIKTNNLTRNIVVLGTLDEKNKRSALKESKIFVFPSYEESFGISLLEAIASGLSAVAYDLPAYEVFGNGAILKVPVGDKKAFSEAVLKLLLDGKLRKGMGEKARSIASRFDWDEIANKELMLLYSPA